ncbi:hypothetical protein PthBH41_15620 [Parageobacillus thermoglucosidasius]|nr:hypothetical protein PthBH41_15620 [Parageobacillus thermoglucosidasius]GAJ42853.1 hypothetical protein GT2_05_00780 [Parageobacillus thermoglucosidasius NBRC 107763]
MGIKRRWLDDITLVEAVNKRVSRRIVRRDNYDPFKKVGGGEQVTQKTIGKKLEVAFCMI